jgi:glutathione synthase/RimK-type ligase-like ATP-grasp enzyme
MIFIITNSRDKTVDHLISVLDKEKRKNIFRLNTDLFINDYNVMYSNTGDESSLWLKDKNNKKKITQNDITGVWYRRPVLPTVDIEDENEQFSKQLSIEARLQIEYIIKTINSVKWLSYPDNIRIAEDKILQIKMARKVGFNIPDTIITNDKKSVEEFYSKHSDICVKPIYSGQFTTDNGLRMFYNTKLNNETIKKLLENVHNFPILLQEYIYKANEYRVTIVNNRVFPVRIIQKNNKNTEYDWRIGNCQEVDFEKIDIPNRISDKIISLLQEFNIKFSSIDLIQGNDNEYYFLDLNPNGQWAWLDKYFDHGISREIYKYLIKYEK